MVTIPEIAQNETELSHEHSKNLVCVFAGATSGIGAATLEHFAVTLKSPTCYVIGRSESRFEHQRSKITAANPHCKIVFLEAQFSLLSEVEKLCETIAAKEVKVDCLFMSPGKLPVNGAEYTDEGLDSCFAISYYCRMRLIYGLLPLLRSAPAPRIVSVLNGGKEGKMLDHDLGLRDSWTALNVVNHTSTMTTLFFQHLAQCAPSITLIHTYPGWVRTGNFLSLEASPASSWVWKLTVGAIKTIGSTLAYTFGITSEECGQRQVFHLTAKRFTAGVWRLDYLSEQAPPSAVLETYEAEGKPKQVYDFTLSLFKQYGSSGK